MKRLPREIQLPKLRAEAKIAPETLNEEARTVEVIFYSGASVQRFPYFDDPYELAFSLDKGAVRLDRFNAGAPLVDNHRDYGPVGDVVLGVVEKAWLASDGGHAIVKIAADRGDILQRLKDGILRNFSMGAVIHQMRDVTQKGDPQRKLLAIDWEPHELSVVPVPADPGAQALAQAERFPCQLLSGASAPERNVMDKIKVRLLATGEVVEIEEQEFDEKLHSKDLTKPEKKTDLGFDPKVAERATADAIELDKARAKEIRRIQAHFNLDDVWAQRHIKMNSTIEQVLADATEERAKNAPLLSGVHGGEDYESIPWRTARMVEALAARATHQDPPEPARQYARFSIAECAFECLRLNGRTRGLALEAHRDPWPVIRLALHSTSDFPLLLENVLNKMLLPAYQLAEPTFRQIARRRNFRDFRPHKFAKGGDFPVPLEKGEHGEFQHGTMGEASEQVSLVSYGRIFAISREVLVNDDLSFFDDLAGAGGRRIADFENATFFARCILAGAGLGPTLSEGSAAVYDGTAHKNVCSAGGLDNVRLAEARTLMLLQKSIDGMLLNIMPRILLAPPLTITTAETLVAQLYPAEASKVNPFQGKLVPITDANLGPTSKRYYLFADPGVGSNYIYGNLEGQTGPRFETRVGFEVDGIEVKLADDFGCGCVDYRFGVTGAGQ